MQLYEYQKQALDGLPPSCIMANLTDWYRPITMVVMECLDCIKKVVARGYCDTHYRQHKKRGGLLPSTQAKRPAIVEDRVAKIPLGINAKHGYALIDVKNIERFERYLWTITKGYAVRNSKENKHVFMHQEVNGKAPKGLVIDHINNNRLDNRTKNLRFVTQQQNTFNTNAKGITWRKDRNKWMARITAHGKTTYLGNFSDIKDAERARAIAKAKYHVI